MLLPVLVTLSAAVGLSQAHIAAWSPGMYCQNGNQAENNDNAGGAPVDPLYQLTKEQYWFQNYAGCPNFPPPKDTFLELPAGGEFTVELAHNRAFTTMSYGGSMTSDWPDGKDHPEDWHYAGNDPDPAVCPTEDGAMHAKSEEHAAGSAFAISYESNISDVTLENLVVFTTLAHTPWKRLATYQVPAAMPACPPEGCTCAWLWIPNRCGQANMYMQGFKCKVTGATSTTPLATAQKPVYCEDDASKCVKGAKQMLVWHQAAGEDNIVTTNAQSPAYSTKCGWATGAQNDIFSSSSSSASSDSCSAVEKRESKRSFSHPLGRFARHVAEVLDDYNL